MKEVNEWSWRCENNGKEEEDEKRGDAQNSHKP